MAYPVATLREALVDRYGIERELGRGGTATVYLARDLRPSCGLPATATGPYLQHQLARIYLLAGENERALVRLVEGTA